ncbi:hypothetical protein F4695_003229 [Rhizobium soli]|uniref:Cytochrome c domain-containing protein n=1 Tax=Rhizobium soli TaxID=424798 RepID=A0A7X0JLI7_9HYPH|nr:cytochrome c [Rhizobium soli]MBB6509845.1 hypothetical protein [Rhizobium soli]
MIAFTSVQRPPPSPFKSSRETDDPLRVDASAVDAGQGVYQAQCAVCHDTNGARYRSPIPIVELGTDRHRVDMWSPVAKSRYADYETGYRWGFTHFQKAEGYVAVDMAGLWLRGPYLHNGSVPTLADLLKSPEQRPKQFYRGSDLVDTVNGGFVSAEQPETGGFLYDTSLPGNGNGGHLWGTDLPQAEKDNLLAYLKTL